jgi:type I restriction enzyme S subunit
MQKIYSLGRGTAQRNLDIEEFKKLEIPVPSLENQKIIVNKVSQIQKTILDLQKNFERKQDSLTELNKSILNMAFFGDLDNVIE